MRIELTLLSIPVESVRVVSGWIVGSLKDFGVSPLTKDDPAALFDQLARFSLSFPDSGFHIGDDALLEFVNIPEQDLRAAAEYIESHGIFARDNLVRPSIPPFPKAVGEFWREEMADHRTPFALQAKAFYFVQREIKNLRKLADAVRERSLKRIAEYISAVQSYRESVGDSTVPDLARARLVLRNSIESGISDVQLGVAESKSTLVPFAAPSALKSALYLGLLDQITRGTAIGECENPRCKKIFERTQPRKRFCSTRCQALIKVLRFRHKPPQRKNSNRKEQK
jgi:hypothetical protein